jgi:predicted Ser/Thr protein kinase
VKWCHIFDTTTVVSKDILKFLATSSFNHSILKTQWEAIYDRQSIYSGPMSTVYKGKWKGTDIVLKVVRGIITEKTQTTLQTEIECLQNLRHPRINGIM